MRIVITGISGDIGRKVAERLVQRGHELLGIDRRPWPDAPRGVEMHHADIRKRQAEDVFRTHRPEACIHLATVTHVSTAPDERYRINLGGTKQVFAYCSRYGVRHCVFVSRHTVYGAAPDVPLYRTEDEPPLAGWTFPELTDLVAADQYAVSALWRWPELTTTVLRVVYTLGPSQRGTLANFIRGPLVPTVLGFDPLYHFMHENDAAKAIITALESHARGVFNVAGPQPVPLSLLCRVTGRKVLPIPEILYLWSMGRFGLPRLTAGAVHHIKYPIVIDGGLFRKTTGFVHDFDEAQTMESFVYA
jgi:UDP-glucose 4-epimerase